MAEHDNTYKSNNNEKSLETISYEFLYTRIYVYNMLIKPHINPGTRYSVYHVRLFFGVALMARQRTNK